MSTLTPTPLPLPRPDEVTQPSAMPGMVPDDARRGLARSPAQFEAEALAMIEEADAREGVAAGALRYAAARLFEDGVGDVAAAMDLLDVERAAAGDVATRADLAVEKAYLLEHRLGAPARARAVLEEALALVPGHAAALLALEESALRASGQGSDPADAALLTSVLERRLASARDAGERGRLLCRLAFIAEADPLRAADALSLWLRALDEDAGLGAAALARAGTVRVAVALGKDAELARAVALEAEAASGVERAAWLALGAALARQRLGAAALGTALV